MNQSMWGLFFIVIGILGIFFINLFEDITSTNDQNYYLLKETTEAAMFDSIDLAQFREYGTLRIVKEKFVENFTRRFAESTNIQKSYKLEFLEIIEEPPKVTVRVGSSSAVTFTEESFDVNIVNVLDAILETDWVGEEMNQPTLKGCGIKYTPAYRYACKKEMELCEPIYDCSGSWETVNNYGHRYVRNCEFLYGDEEGKVVSFPCGPCVAVDKPVNRYNLSCPSDTAMRSGMEEQCVLSKKRVCNGVITKIGDDCKRQMVYTTCYEQAKYEVVCD
jgi:hypothetical protein